MKRKISASLKNSLICVCVILLVLSQSIYANNDKKINAKKEQLKQVSTEIKSLKSVLAKDKHKRQSLEKQLRKTEIEIGQIDIKLHGINNKLATQNKILSQLQKRHKKYQHDLQAQQDVLTQQIKAAYIASHQNALKFLLNQQDPEQLSRMMHYYEYLNTARVNIITNIHTVLEQIDANREEINKHTVVLNQLLTEQKHKKSDLNHVLKQRNTILQQLNHTISSNNQKLAAMISDKLALEQVIAKLKKSKKATIPSFVSLKGKLGWPTKGRIISQYNTPIDNSQIKRSGIIIAAPQGQNVYAVAAGKVVFADWLKGYGLLMIIEHGKGYLTLYGYNQSLYKHTGDIVRAGDLIATVGDTGGQRHNALYFAIRESNTPLDPLSWLDKNHHVA